MIVRMVAPCAGAWIEILQEQQNQYPYQVAPCAGAWIEIKRKVCKTEEIMSLPVRERGLK